MKEENKEFFKQSILTVSYTHLSCFMFEEGVDLETKIQEKLEAFSDTVGNYKECPVVIIASVATINPGESVTEALDLADHTVKGVNAEKSICIMAKE